MDKYLTAQTDDWEISLIGGAAVAYLGGAGMFLAAIHSEMLDVYEGIVLTAAGIGLGGNQTGFDPTQLETLSYTDALCSRPFSISDLHRSLGWITDISASSQYGNTKSATEALTKLGMHGTGAGQAIDLTSIGLCAIGAKDLFSTNLYGASVGSGAGLYSFAGYWFSYTLNNSSIEPITPLAEEVSAVIDKVLGGGEAAVQSLTRGIYRLYGIPAEFTP